MKQGWALARLLDQADRNSNACSSVKLPGCLEQLTAPFRCHKQNLSAMRRPEFTASFSLPPSLPYKPQVENITFDTNHHLS